MNYFIKYFLVQTFIIMACSPVTAQVTQKQQELRGEVETKTGKIVRLFHSGTKDVKNTICIGDLIPVYREVYAYGAIKKTEVGKIKVITYVGEHYFEAEIIAGKIKTGDVAQKESVSCLVYPAPDEE